MSEFQQFLYVTVKEVYPKSKKGKTDTVLRIVFWAADEELGYDDHFVIYGKRPKSKVTGNFTPYRLICQTQKQVIDLVQTVVSPDHNIAVELHQFYGYNDDSEDWYNIDWKNTADDSSTELVAFDVESSIGSNGELFLGFHVELSRVLNVIENHEII